MFFYINLFNYYIMVDTKIGGIRTTRPTPKREIVVRKDGYGYFDRVAHPIKSVAVGSRKGFKYLMRPILPETNINNTFLQDELEILWKIHSMKESKPGNIKVVPLNEFEPIHMNLETITKKDIVDILKQDYNANTEYWRAHGFKSDLASTIDDIFKKDRLEEIKRLKLAPEGTSHEEKVFYIYNLLKGVKNLQEKNKKYRENNEPVGIYYRFEGNDEELDKYINEGKIDVYVGDLKCKARDCIREESNTDVVKLTENSESTKRKRTKIASGGRKKSKTRKRRSRR